jgi:hypothetical protein
VNRPRLTEQTRATVSAIATWVGALGAIAVLVIAAVASLSRGLNGWEVGNVIAWLIATVWLAALSLIVIGHGERIDSADDTSDEALTTARNHTHDGPATTPTGIAVQRWADGIDDHGRHAAPRPTPRPREKETAE